MNRVEKNQQTRQRIMRSALKEFSCKNYAEASLNTIADDEGLSKGIIYHYFKNKDDLYLECVRECMQRLTAYMVRCNIANDQDIETCLVYYFDARKAFFMDNTLYFKLFCDAMIDPPKHLSAEIDEIKRGFNDYNERMLSLIVKKAKLAQGITIDMVIDIFTLFQDIFNARQQKYVQHNVISEELIKEHELKCHQMIGVFLYGILDRKQADEN